MASTLSIHDWFRRKKETQETSYVRERLDIPGNLWVKCYKCSQALYNRELEANQKVCPKCGYHFKLTAGERISQIVDNGNFAEINGTLRSTNFLNFSDTRSYTERIKWWCIQSRKNNFSWQMFAGDLHGIWSVLCKFFMTNTEVRYEYCYSRRWF